MAAAFFEPERLLELIHRQPRPRSRKLHACVRRAAADATAVPSAFHCSGSYRWGHARGWTDRQRYRRREKGQ